MATHSLLLSDFSLESSKNDPDFFNKLAQAFGRVVGTGKNKTDKAFFGGDEVGEIIKLLGQRFNMRNITFEEGGPAVLMPFLNPNHVDYDDFVRSIFADPQVDINGDEEIKSVMNKLKVKVAVGSVDIQNGWVEGIYVDLPVLFMYPRAMLERGDVFSPEEKAAIMLHECGHVLNFYDRMTQVIKANVIASTLLKTMDGRAPYEVKKTIFVESAKLNGASEQAYERALKSNNKDAVATLVIGEGVFAHGRRFENGQNGTYASTQAEQTADQFATRFGGGKHIVTGLDKIYTEYGEFSLGKAFSLLFVILMMIWMTICTLGLIWLVIVASMSAEEIYDDPYTRFARVRYELINQLRASSLPQKQIMEIIDQTDLIKKVQVRYNENEHRSSMWLRVAGIFRRGLRDDLAMEYLEKDLEKLANNDLFVSSARLKTVGT